MKSRDKDEKSERSVEDDERALYFEAEQTPPPGKRKKRVLFKSLKKKAESDTVESMDVAEFRDILKYKKLLESKAKENANNSETLTLYYGEGLLIALCLDRSLVPFMME